MTNKRLVIGCLGAVVLVCFGLYMTYFLVMRRQYELMLVSDLLNMSRELRKETGRPTETFEPIVRQVRSGGSFSSKFDREEWLRLYELSNPTFIFTPAQKGNAASEPTFKVKFTWLFGRTYTIRESELVGEAWW
jgi:hypothetical protein